MIMTMVPKGFDMKNNVVRKLVKALKKVSKI